MRVVFKLVVVALAAATFSSCLKVKKQDEWIKDYVSTIIVDSCEYVYLQNDKGIALVHKANCSNHKKTKHCVFCHSNVNHEQ